MVRIYGRYCGPNWTAGKNRSAKDTPIEAFTKVKPIDALDDACLLHDVECRRNNGCTKASDIRLATRANRVVRDPKSTKKQKEAAKIVRNGILLASKFRLK
tara:strand:+ start:703 stop:1005 length:303 start_codon:yes stop_codon:yes gene_type:complete